MSLTRAPDTPLCHLGRAIQLVLGHEGAGAGVEVDRPPVRGRHVGGARPPDIEHCQLQT